MPFIKQNRRKSAEENTLLNMHKGDICYIIYKKMVDQWRDEPCFDVAYNIYEQLVHDKMSNFAWQVFFQLYIMPYELQKRKENGDI